MKLKFILVYGLPGAGKTTLCNKISELRDDVVYINLAKHPDFGKRDTLDILVDTIKSTDVKDKHIITEGCFPNAKFRRMLITKIKTKRVSVFVYLHEYNSVLAKRRNRSAYEYKKLKDKVQITKHCITIQTKKLQDRIKELSNILDSD